MVSSIVIAKEKKKREAFVKDYANKHTIHQFDITLIEKDTTKKTTQSIGIEEVKKIQEKIFLKPLKGIAKLIVFEDAHLLTPEAQNALLKVLEEPPPSAHIILAAETKEALLPTIHSRCQIIELEKEEKKLSAKTVEELHMFTQALPELSLGERLKYAEQLAKDKEKALMWIENLILIVREELLSTVLLEKSETTTPESMTNSNYMETLTSLQSLHTLLKTTNVNPRFAIEHTLLSL